MRQTLVVSFLGILHDSLFHPEATTCSHKFLRYFVRLYILLCLRVINHFFAIHLEIKKLTLLQH